MKTFNPIPAMEEVRWGDGEYVLRVDAEEEIANREEVIERLQQELAEAWNEVARVEADLKEAQNYE